MKKFFGILIAMAILNITKAQISGDAALNKCPGGRCVSDCWFTDCSLCCPEATRAECSCFFEFSRCTCKSNPMALDVVITVHYDRLVSFTGWLKTNGNRLLTPFQNLQNSLLAAKTTSVSATDFRVLYDRYAAALASFEKSVAGLSATEDYRKAQTEIDARKLAR
jgi:hypothetical protein